MCSLYNLQILKLRNCKSFKEFPSNLHKLSNLRYLDFSGTMVRRMPMDFEKLKDLQVLSSFYVERGIHSNIQQLGELNLHGTCSISELQNIINPSDASAANLKNKAHLVKLELKWNANSENSVKVREVLEKLQPSKHLMELSILSYGGTRFPDWFGDNSLSNVVSLKLSNCINCVLLPPLGILPSLKKLEITGLFAIVLIGREFYRNESISSSVIIPFASLQTLVFEDMKGWKEWDCKTVTNAFPHLQTLPIRNCPNLKACLPEQLPCLMKLEISCCEQLVASVSLSPSVHEMRIIKCGKLQVDYHPATLKILKISGPCMKELLLEMEHTLSHTTLKSLEIEDCPTMEIPLGSCYNFLVDLDIISSCDSLRTFPLHFFPKLESLNLEKCSNLEMISQDYKLDYSLKFLSISFCTKFVSFPKGGFSAPSLMKFEIRKLENLKSLPECMHTFFPSLTGLNIYDCPQLESFSDEGLPSSLPCLNLNGCSNLLIGSMKCALGINPSLTHLKVEKVDAESFPDQGLLPLSVTSLTICNCINLKNLDYKGLCQLTSLQKLYLIDCPNLQCLPVEGLPKSLSILVINCCPLVTQRCKKPDGEDWGKISHIPYVIINICMINGTATLK